MKRITSLILILVLILAAAGVVWLRQGKKDDSKQSISADSKIEVEQDVSDSDKDDNKNEEEEIEPEYVSDPIYGDGLTQEELDAFKAEDAADDAQSPGVTVGEEFVIILDDNQDTGGF